MLPSELIETYGAFAGIAAIVGLAVLSLLLFTQAREIKRLRDWVGRAPERDAELAARVRTEAGRPPGAPQRGGPAPTGAAAAAAAAAQARPPAGQPANGAPRPQQPGAVPAAPAGAPATAAARGAAPAPQPTQGEPGTVPPARQGAAQGPVHPAAPDRAPDDGQRPAVQAAPRPPAAAAGSPSATVPPRARRPGAQPPPPPTDGAGRRRPALAGVAVAAGVLLVLAVGVLVLTGTFGDGGQPAPAEQPSNGVAPAQGGGSAEQPRPRGEVTVAVLNGTTTAGLATSKAEQVARSGFRPGGATDNDVQNLSATTIEYAEGYRASAREVAEVIGVGADAIGPLDRNTRVLAGEEANVVIIVGADGTQAAGGAG